MDIVKPSDEEHRYIYTVIKEIMKRYELPDVFRAELYRELGMFEEALEILKTCSPSEDYMIAVIEKIKLYAENKSTIHFYVSTSIKKLSPTHRHHNPAVYDPKLP